MSTPRHRTSSVPGLTLRTATPTMDVVTVGGSLDELSVSFPARHRYVEVASSGAAVLVFASLGGNRFQPLRVHAGGHHAGVALTPVQPGAVAEVYVFSGYRAEPARFGRTRRRAVYVHVETRPLRVSPVGGRQRLQVG